MTPRLPCPLSRRILARSALLPLLLVAALVGVVGCAAPRVRLERVRPARFQLGEERRVALQVDTEGEKPSASTVLDAVVGMAEGQVLNKWVAVEPLRSELGAQLREARHRVVDPATAELVIHVVPTAWSFEREGARELRKGKGRLEARVEVLDARNPKGPPLFQDTYRASAEVEKVGEPEAMVRAAQSLSRCFVADLRPGRVAAEVELDDSDPLVRPGVELSRQGHFDAARAAFSDAVVRAPDSAPALYDLAVLTEAEGDLAQAEDLLVRATRIDNKALYYEALERVRRTRRETEDQKRAP